MCISNKSLHTQKICISIHVWKIMHPAKYWIKTKFLNNSSVWFCCLFEVFTWLEIKVAPYIGSCSRYCYAYYSCHANFEISEAAAAAHFSLAGYIFKNIHNYLFTHVLKIYTNVSWNYINRQLSARKHITLYLN